MEGFGFSAHQALVLPPPRFSLFLIFSFFYLLFNFLFFKPGLSRTLRRLGEKKSKTVKFSRFFRKGTEGKAVLLVCWQDVGQQGASCLWCTGSCVCSFDFCRDTHTHTLWRFPIRSLGPGVGVCTASGRQCEPLGALWFRFQEKGGRCTEKILQIKQKISCSPFW